MKAETLKKSILQYAMQGKLVAQDPNDEPASELLKRIKAEKEQLIKDVKIKKEKTLPPITEEEIPYELPQGWEWCRLGSILTKLTDGAHKTPTYTNSGIPFLSVKDMSTGKLNFSNTKFVSKEEHEILYKRCNPQEGDLLVTKVGTTGVPVIVDTDREFSLFVSVALLKFNNELINIKYLYYMILSPLVAEQVRANTKGVGNQNWVIDKIAQTIITIPPLAEQQRIVEKLEEILPLVEEYGKNEEILSEMNKKLPKQIRQSILQYAVQGKLVPQNPNDQPASELLKRIKAEKEQLVKDGKTKKEKPLPPITEDEIPYELPQGWEWVKLRDICEILNGYAFKSDFYVGKSNNQIIRLGNVKNNGLVLEASPTYIPDDIAETAENYLLRENDILVTLTGTRLKRDYFYTSLVENKDIKHLNLYLNQRVGCLRFYSGINPKLLNIFLKSKFILDNIFEHETGTANQGNIGTGATGELLVPLPPLAEQQRIVTKVEELMQIVDKLE